MEAEKEKEFNKKFLLVEGNNDKHVVWALREKLKISENFDVIDCRGRGELGKFIETTLKAPGVEALGIVIDADKDLRGSWNSVKDILKKDQGVVAPDELPKTGWIGNFSNGFIKVGVWIMPDNNLNGMLEDFISFMLPKDDKLMSVVEATLEDIEKKGLNKYAPIHRSKAKIHTWLSWQKYPGTPLGASITNKVLTTESETCVQFADWLKQLFEN